MSSQPAVTVSCSPGDGAARRRPARSSDRRVARGLRLAPTAVGSTSRPGRCSAGHGIPAKRLPVPRGPEQEPGSIEAIALLGAALAAEGKVEEAIPTSSEPWSSTRATPRPTSTWACFSPMAGDRRARSLISTRRSAFSLTTSRRCGRRLGFWPRAPIPRLVTERGRPTWPGVRSDFPGAKSCAAGRSGRRTGRKRGVFGGRRRGRASVNDGPASRRRGNGRRHCAADAPLSPGIAVSRTGLAAAGWGRMVRRAASKCPRSESSVSRRTFTVVVRYFG